MEDLKKYIGMRVEGNSTIVDVGYYNQYPVALIMYDKQPDLRKNGYSVAIGFNVTSENKLKFSSLQFFLSERSARKKFNKLMKQERTKEMER